MYVLAYFFVIAIIGFSVGLGYRGRYVIANEPNWYITVIGFIILLPFLIFYLISNRKLNKQSKKNLLEIKSLKSTGIQIEIDLTELEITQNKTDSIIPNKVIINKYGERNFQTKLSLKNKINYTFYTDINKENLKIYFALNPKTYLFTDKKKKYKQYLDLEFLEK
jgi:c-di-AMP phosphodiesterase-like protein